MTSRILSPAELFIRLEHFLLERQPPSAFRALTVERLPSPDRYPNPTVQLTREQLLRFRADFAELTSFVCAVCLVRPEDLCRFDLLAALRRQTHVEMVLEAAKTLVEALPVDDPRTAVALRKASHHLAALGRFGSLGSQETPT